MSLHGLCPATVARLTVLGCAIRLATPERAPLRQRGPFGDVTASPSLTLIDQLACGDAARRRVRVHRHVRRLPPPARARAAATPSRAEVRWRRDRRLIRR